MNWRKWILAALAVLLLLFGTACGETLTTRAAQPETGESVVVTVEETPAAKATPGPDKKTRPVTPAPTEIPASKESLTTTDAAPEDGEAELAAETFVLNTNTKKYHDPSCASVDEMSEKNKRIYEGTREDVESMGYVACKRCGG